MLTRERRDQAARDHAEGLEGGWEDDAFELWNTARALSETTVRGRRSARSSRRQVRRLLGNPATSLDSKPSDVEVRKLARMEATIATEQKPVAAAPTPPPDEMDADVPAWVWAELEKIKEEYNKDVIRSELPDSG
eukprot:gene14008-16560_t